MSASNEHEQEEGREPEPAASDLSSRVVVLEGRVRHLEERLEAVRQAERGRKQNALLWRLLLLAVLLGGYFVLRALRA